MDFLNGSAVKNPPANAGDSGSIFVSGRSLREGNGNPLQCSCMGNPMHREARQSTVHEIATESDTTKWASLVAQLVKNLPAMRETWV